MFRQRKIRPKGTVKALFALMLFLFMFFFVGYVSADCNNQNVLLIRDRGQAVVVRERPNVQTIEVRRSLFPLFPLFRDRVIINNGVDRTKIVTGPFGNVRIVDQNVNQQRLLIVR